MSTSNTHTLVDPKKWKKHLFGFPRDRWISFDGQSYWVTGAGTGYGQSMAVALAAAGARVFITGRRPEKLQDTIKTINSLGIPTDKCHSIVADITNGEQMQQACREIESLCPSLDGIINNAALPNRPGSTSPLQNDPMDYWKKLIATNVTGAWNLTRTIFKHLLKSSRPRVLFIGSGAGWAATPGVGPYNISKAAQNALSHSMAQEYSHDFPHEDIQINTLVAGEAQTEMNQGSDVSPYVIVRMALLLLSQEKDGPNGCFFSAEGDHLSFGETEPFTRPLMEVNEQFKDQATSRPEAQQPKQACLHQFLAYDEGPEDIKYLAAFARCFPELHRHLSSSTNSKLAFYGAGKLTKYFLDRHPETVGLVECIIDDDPAKQKKQIHGIPIISLEDLPESVENVFLASSRAEGMFAMQKALDRRRKKTNYFDFSVAGQLIPGVIPVRAWRNYENNIYPIEIPKVEFEKNKDMLLLEMPPRYMPFMPYGIGCVHNILKGTGLNFQTMDLNIIWYHRYHMARLLDGVENAAWLKGDQLDPWDSTVAETWDNSEIPTEYQINEDEAPKSRNLAIEYFREQVDEVIDEIVKAKPRMLGFSLNLNNTCMVHEVIKGVKKRLPDVLVLVGGYAFYSHQLSLARSSDLYDYVIVGEAEYSLPPLIKKLKESFKTGDYPKDLPGILSKFDTPDRKFGKMPNVSDLSNQPFPRYEWVPYKFYATYDNNHTVPTCTSRGCSWSRCKFCCETAKYYYRDPVEFVDELEWHVNQGAFTFNLFESDINGNHENLQKIMKEIVKRGLKVNLYGQFRIDRRNTPEFFRDLKAAGFSMVRFGVDGWCDNVLKNQLKSANMKITERNLKDATEAGLLCNVNMVLGVPGETEEDIEESYENIVRLKPYINMFETLNMLRVAAGSQYYEDPDKYKIRFRGDRDEIYRKNKTMLPENLWYSEDPYIDDAVRVQRFRKIVRGCHEGGVTLGDYIKWSVVQEVNRIEGGNETDFEKVIYAEPANSQSSEHVAAPSTINNFGLQGEELDATAKDSPTASKQPEPSPVEIGVDNTKAEPRLKTATQESAAEEKNKVPEVDLEVMGKHENGLWYANGDKQAFSGKALHYRSPNRKQVEFNFKDGRINGPHLTWHENGEKEIQTVYVNGAENGHHIEWYDNNQMKWESTFEGGQMISLKGWSKNGEQKNLEEWNLDGSPKSQSLAALP